MVLFEETFDARYVYNFHMPETKLIKMPHHCELFTLKR